jgi:hypothetical protein
MMQRHVRHSCDVRRAAAINLSHGKGFRYSRAPCDAMRYKLCAGSATRLVAILGGTE